MWAKSADVNYWLFFFFSWEKEKKKKKNTWYFIQIVYRDGLNVMSNHLVKSKIHFKMSHTYLNSTSWRLKAQNRRRFADFDCTLYACRGPGWGVGRLLCSHLCNKLPFLRTRRNNYLQYSPDLLKITQLTYNSRSKLESELNNYLV